MKEHRIMTAEEAARQIVAAMSARERLRILVPRKAGRFAVLPALIDGIARRAVQKA
jgi:hypothetical protein